MLSVKERFKELAMLWDFFKPYHRETSFVLVSMIISGALESLNLAAVYPIIDHGLALSKGNAHLQFLNTLSQLMPAPNLFVGACYLLILITIVSSLVKIGHNYLANRLIKHVVCDYQKAIFDKLQKADYGYYIESQQGKLVYAGTVAPTNFSYNVFYIVRLVNSLITCLAFTVLLFVLSWQGTVMIALLGVVFVFFIRGMTKGLINKASRQATEEERKKNIILNEFITGIKAIKIFHVENVWANKFNSAVEIVALNNFKVNLGRILPDTFIKFAFFMIFAGVGIFLGMQSEHNMIGWLPLLATFATVASRLFPYINLLGNDIVSMARLMPDTKIVYDLLHENSNQMQPGQEKLSSFTREIVFEKVSFIYPGAHDYVLDEVSFSIDQNRVTAIVGPSGSGKTSIVNLLLRLYDTKQGTIKFEGKDIREFEIGSYRKNFGYVGQETFIFNGTIKENILFGGRGFSDQQIEEAARLANAHEFILNAECGYDTIVGDAGMKISGGERQRIAIARAILRKPNVIVFDEATSSLDNVSERAVQEAINNISKHTTVLIIAHRLSTVQKADKIIVLKWGEIVEEGTHEELLNKKNAYFELYTT